MQLFSRKKALVALSLGASFALGACGDDVTVPVAPDAAVVISITPPSATMNIGESLTFAVQITGGSKTTPPTLTGCVSSNNAVATAAVATGACRLTAVAAGNVTVTATASTGGQAAASVTVAPAAAAISNLTTSPTIANIAVGSKVTIIPNVARAGASVTPTYGYTSSNSTIASVNLTTGEVTAAAPGTATITVTATGSGTGFTTTTLTAGVTINVTAAPPAISSLTVQPTSLALALGSTSQLLASAAQPAGAAAAVISYGSTSPAIAGVNATTGLVTALAPGSAVITVTATSPANASFSAATLTQLVPVIVSPSANVTINSINQGPIVTSYFQQSLSVSNAYSIAEEGLYESANSQVNQPVDINNVRDQIQLVVNLQPNGQRVDSVVAFIANADGSNRRPAARQLYSNSTANAEQITLYVNTADFTANFAAGTADVFYPNGQKIISVSVFTSDAPGVNNREIQNASNNRQTVNFNNLDGYAANNVNPARVAQGDPSYTNKANLNWWGGPGAQGEGNSTIIPVFYTPGRTLRIMDVSMMQGLNNLSFPYWIQVVCSTYQYAGPANPTPSALPYKTVYGAAPTATTSIDCSGYQHPEITQQNFVGVTNSIDKDNNPGPRVTRPDGFRRSAQVSRPTPNRLDYRGPNTSDPDIRRYRPAITGWVNAAFNFQTNTDESNDGNGVGVKANSRAWSYWGCAATTPVPMTTVTGADIPECPTDFLGGWQTNTYPYTRGPYMVGYVEQDRLTNASTSEDSWPFGVDKTVPLIRFSAASVADTAFRTASTSLAGAFQAEFSDERAGFIDNNDNGSWLRDGDNTYTYTFLSGTDVANIYPTDRSQQHFLVHAAGFLPLANYSTRSQCLVASTSTSDLWRLRVSPFGTAQAFLNPAATFLSNPGCTFINAYALQGGDLGDGYRPGSSVALPAEGIYRYDTRVYDRAGNVSSTLSRKYGIDVNAANFSALNTPLSVALGGAATFPATYEDNTEVRASSLKLQYNPASGTTLANQLGLGAVLSIAGTDTLVYPQTLIDARFNDVINGPTTTNLTTPFGAPFVTTIEFVNASSQVIANNNGSKASLVGGTMWDFADRQDAQGAGATPRQATILGSALADPVGFGAWTTANPTLGFQAWTVLPGLLAGFNAGTGLKAQVTATTNSVNAPFVRVDFYRRGTGVAVTGGVTAAVNNVSTLHYIGSSSSAASADQGATRFWTYLAPATLAPATNKVASPSAAVASFDNIVAVGVRSTGEALATQQMTIEGAAITVTTAGTSLAWSVTFTSGSNVFTRTSAGTFGVPAGSYSAVGNTVTVPVTGTGSCPSGLATSTIAPNPAIVVVGPAATAVTVTRACVP